MKKARKFRLRRTLWMKKPWLSWWNQNSNSISTQTVWFCWEGRMSTLETLVRNCQRKLTPNGILRIWLDALINGMNQTTLNCLKSQTTTLTSDSPTQSSLCFQLQDSSRKTRLRCSRLTATVISSKWSRLCESTSKETAVPTTTCHQSRALTRSVKSISLRKSRTQKPNSRLCQSRRENK